MIFHRKCSFMLLLILCLIITGCSNKRTSFNDGNQNQEQESSKVEEKNLDYLETYRNHKYMFSFDIPVEWKGKYKVVEQDKIIYFLHSGFPDLEGKILWIVVLTEEEYKEFNTVQPTIPESAILGRKNNLVYFYYTPVAVPSIENNEDMKKCVDEWGRMNDALYEVPNGVHKRFHFE